MFYLILNLLNISAAFSRHSGPARARPGPSTVRRVRPRGCAPSRRRSPAAARVGRGSSGAPRGPTHPDATRFQISNLLYVHASVRDITTLQNYKVATVIWKPGPAARSPSRDNSIQDRRLRDMGCHAWRLRGSPPSCSSLRARHGPSFSASPGEPCGSASARRRGWHTSCRSPGARK